MLACSVGAGMCSPAVMTKSLSVNPRVTGFAAGLCGCTQMAVAAICTALAALGSKPTLSAAVVMAGAGTLGIVAFVIGLTHERSQLRLKKEAT